MRKQPFTEKGNCLQHKIRLYSLSMPELWLVEQRKQIRKKQKFKLKYQHLRKVRMDINEISEHIVGKTIEAVDVVFGEDTMIIYLDDGSDVELIIDTIYCNVPDKDD